MKRDIELVRSIPLAMVIKPAAGVAFDVLVSWLKHEAMQRLGLP